MAGPQVILPRKRPAEAMEAPETDGARFVPGFKTKLCNYWPNCNRGDACTFAHGEEELQPRRSAGGGHGNEAFNEEMTFLDNLAQEGVDEEQPEEFAEGDEVGEALDGEAEGEEKRPSNAPRVICGSWLQHASLCKQGERCPYAHGLGEMGMEGQAVTIHYNGTGATATVEAKAKLIAPIRDGSRPYYNSGGKGPMIVPGKGGGFKGPPRVVPAKKGPGLEPMIVPAIRSPGHGGAMLALGGPPSWASSKGGGFHPDPSTMWQPSRFEDENFAPTKICQHWVKEPTNCRKGDECTFAHGVHELRPSAIDAAGVSRFLHTGMEPTRMCNYFAQGKCSKSLFCTFAHSPDELRQGKR